MALTLDDLLDSVRATRAHFFKHLEGLTAEQWDWKPYPECKSIRETLAHLVVDDRAAIQSLETGGEPDYEGLSAIATDEAGGDLTKQRAILEGTHNQLLTLIKSRFGDAPLDTEISLWGSSMKLARAVAYLSSEDFYHAGQVAFIRQATDPTWDYYAAIYGFSG
jgi:uncharacterized damage-inducible protein DinB